MIYGISYRIIGAVVGVIALIVAVGLFVRSCDARHSRAAQERVAHSQAEAQQQSAEEAINTVAAAGQREAESEALSRSNEKDIRNAEGSDAAVNPAARDAGIRALCLRNAYRNDPRCRVQQPHSR